MRHAMIAAVLLGSVCPLGCSSKNDSRESPSGEPGGSALRNDGVLRYTIRDVNGVRASVNRESVLKTVGVTEQQVGEWANDPAGIVEKRAVGHDLIKAASQSQQPQHTITNPNGSISSQNKESSARAGKILSLLFQNGAHSNSQGYQTSAEQLREWVRDEGAAGEGRSARIMGSGYTEIIWRGMSGRVLYTFTGSRGYVTSQNRDSAVRAMKNLLVEQPASGGSGGAVNDVAFRERDETSKKQIREWVEDTSAAGEGRSASIAMNEYVEMISWGVMEEPPYLSR